MTTKTLADFREARQTLSLELQTELENTESRFDTFFLASKNESLPINQRSSAMEAALRAMAIIQTLKAKLAVLRATTDLLPC